MTINLLVLILLWTFIIVCLAGLLIIVFVIGKSSVKDNPGEAWVFVKTGTHINKPLKARLSEKGSKGQSFIYNNKIVMTPRTYKELYHRGKRIIFINRAGQIVASPFNDDVTLDDTEKGNLIYEMCASHVGADGMRALKGNQTMNVIIVAVISLIVGAIATYGVISFMDLQKQKANVANTQTQGQAGQEISPPVKVK